MRPSLLFACAFLLSAAGCGGSTESPPQEPGPQSGSAPAPSGASKTPAPVAPTPSTPAGPSGPTTSGAPCGEFRGKIHGESTCKSVDRPSGAVTTMAVRAGSPTMGAQCNKGSVSLDTMIVHVECVESGSGENKHAVVTLVVDDDTKNPALKGKRLELDQHDGFWDFIGLWIGIRTSSVEVTIDYGVLE